jgi:hypothetical protein
MTTGEPVENAIALLQKVRERRGMYVGDNRLRSIQNFLFGFEMGLAMTELRLDIRQATENRGWRWTSTGGFNLMEERGMSEDEQCLEAIDIYLEALRLLSETNKAEQT